MKSVSRGASRIIPRMHPEQRSPLRTCAAPGAAPLARAALLATLVALGAACESRSERAPNLVVIALDTLRPDHLGCYGYARDTSPNLDRWAAQSVVFENAQSAAPWTAPSLISLMTSLYPSVHGVASFNDPGQMNERVTTLAEVLAARGYWTAAFTDGGYAKAQFGLGQGFRTYPLNEGDLPGEHASNLREPSRLRPNIDRTLRWLDEVDDEPFFLFFHTYEIHGPYQPPEPYVKRYRPDWNEAQEHERLAQVKQRWSDEREIDAAGLRLLLAHREHCSAARDLDLTGIGQKMKELGVGAAEPERMQLWRDLYDAEIRHTDFELERLLARLESPELRDNTVVVFVSDHGEGFGEHGMVGHGSVLHEENLRVLFMLRAPGVAPARVKELVRTIDVMPTALELLGADGKELALQGRSLAPLLSGRPLPAAPSFSHALSQIGRESRLWSVRDGDWRLVWDNEQASARLFQLGSDPQEARDVAAEHPETAERLLGLMRAQCDLDRVFFDRASGPVKNDYEFDDATRRELEKLGYVDGAPGAEPRLTPRGLDRPSYCGH